VWGWESRGTRQRPVILLSDFEQQRASKSLGEQGKQGGIKRMQAFAVDQARGCSSQWFRKADGSHFHAKADRRLFAASRKNPTL
jgi:hypothetical protein